MQYIPGVETYFATGHNSTHSVNKVRILRNFRFLREFFAVPIFIVILRAGENFSREGNLVGEGTAREDSLGTADIHLSTPCHNNQKD
jgi:hypothetical protein